MACPHYTSPEERPARIRYYAKHNAVISGCRETFSCFEPHAYGLKHTGIKISLVLQLQRGNVTFSKYKVSTSTQFSQFMQFIKHRTVSLIGQIHAALFICPLIEF